MGNVATDLLGMHVDTAHGRKHRQRIVAGLFLVMVVTAWSVADDRAAAEAVVEAEVAESLEGWIEPLERAGVEFEVWFEDDWVFVAFEGEAARGLVGVFEEAGSDAVVWWEDDEPWVEVGFDPADRRAMAGWTAFWSSG